MLEIKTALILRDVTSQEGEIGRGGEWGIPTPRRGSKTPQDEMVKVLTSATFIRGVFGILKKVMK
jgi:hypothetical protein